MTVRDVNGPPFSGEATKTQLCSSPEKFIECAHLWLNGELNIPVCNLWMWTGELLTSTAVNSTHALF